MFLDKPGKFKEGDIELFNLQNYPVSLENLMMGTRLQVILGVFQFVSLAGIPIYCAKVCMCTLFHLLRFLLFFCLEGYTKSNQLDRDRPFDIKLQQTVTTSGT